MDKNNIGIVVENDYNDILYYDNSFIVNINISNKDIRAKIENKLEEILEGKAFRIDRISKKIPKLTKHNSTENMIMYFVKVYMYSDNSDFKSKEYVLDSITIPSYKDYFLKYFIRYDKYNNLVCSYASILSLIFYFLIFFNPKFIFFEWALANNFWISLLVYIVIPAVIIDKLIVQSIVNHLIKYDISKKIFKISKLITSLMWVVYVIIMIFILGNR